MLSAEGCALRRARFWKALERPCDTVIISDPRHLVYFANYYASPFVFRSAGAMAVLVMEPGSATLCGDNVAQPFLEASHVDRVATAQWYDGVRSARARRECVIDEVIGLLPQKPARQIGVESSSIPGRLLAHLSERCAQAEITDVEAAVSELARAKDPDEIAVLARSIRAGESAQEAALEQVSPGMTEVEVALLVQEAAGRQLGAFAEVYGDFVSGPRCETEGGGPPSLRVIERGDLFLLDLSVVVHGYRGDFTNTFAVGREPTPKQAELCEACKAALVAAEKTLGPGRMAREVDAAVRASFSLQGLAQYFTTHSGHGVGLGHPEAPFIVPESRDTLQIGDVIALEPGLYAPGIGGMRYEHNYLITADGFERLSRHRLTLAP
jgi:Xaa-Pro aminopeptidase